MSRNRGHAKPFVIAIFVIALDIALMAPLLRTLSGDFGITHRWSAWVIALYLAVFSFALPFAESWMRSIDSRRLFSVSLLLLAIGSVVGAVAPAWLLLLVGRTLQAQRQVRHLAHVAFEKLAQRVAVLAVPLGPAAIRRERADLV